MRTFWEMYSFEDEKKIKPTKISLTPGKAIAIGYSNYLGFWIGSSVRKSVCYGLWLIVHNQGASN